MVIFSLCERPGSIFGLCSSTGATSIVAAGLACTTVGFLTLGTFLVGPAEYTTFGFVIIGGADIVAEELGVLLPGSSDFGGP